MIYLIDDTSLESVNGLFLLDEKYKLILYRIESLDNLKKHIDRLLSADCIMIHRTFAESTICMERMKELTQEGEKIPLVVFSAGDNETADFKEEKPYLVNSIKKTVFYTNLSIFLDSYLESNCIDLRLIAFGKDFIKAKVRSLALSIFQSIANEDGNIEVSDLAKIASNPNFKELITISNPSLGLSYNDLLEDLEDNPITFLN